MFICEVTSIITELQTSYHSQAAKSNTWPAVMWER